MKRIVIAAISLLTVSLIGHSEEFRFKHRTGDKYNIITEVSENIYVDGSFHNSAEILNKITVEVQNVHGEAGFLSGVFRVFEKAWGAYGPFRLNDEVYRSEFWRDGRGRYDIGAEYLMPIVRGIPLFPEQDIQPDAYWTAEAEEMHDLTAFGVPEPLSVPLSVHYRYVGRETRDGVRVAVFEIQYSASVNLRDVPSPGFRAPLKIKGSSEQIYRWDIARGRPYSYQDSFDYIYVISDGTVIEFEGSSLGKVVDSRPLDRDAVVEKIQKEIDERGIIGAEVTADDEGVTIILEDINFPPESDYLMPGEQEKLDIIGDILSAYPERDLLILGHTALAGTPEGRVRLSEMRAKAVAVYFLSQGVRDEDQMIVKGLGATVPRADNRTEEGMRKNRRVEIKILEN